MKHTGPGVTGTASDVLEECFETRAADGFILMLPTLPASLEDFTALVVPELRLRGLFREDYEGRTLRENLGVPRPRTRWAGDRCITDDGSRLFRASGLNRSRGRASGGGEAEMGG